MNLRLSIVMMSGYILGCGNADPNRKPGTESDTVDAFTQCDGECLFNEWTTCTCAPEDPCGWAGDGKCDKACGEVVDVSFDDADDCDGPCEGECSMGWTPCTCGPDDPCGWQGDGECDHGCVVFGLVEESFDDSEDCPGPCQGECELAYTECTCASDDPCGWQSNGYCDRACEIYDIVPETFDDSEDCQGTCNGECSAFLYTTCTCGVDDPCQWQGNGYCDDTCLESEEITEMFDDTADCGE